jgi:hypothetical protein
VAGVTADQCGKHISIPLKVFVLHPGIKHELRGMSTARDLDVNEENESAVRAKFADVGLARLAEAHVLPLHLGNVLLAFLDHLVARWRGRGRGVLETIAAVGVARVSANFQQPVIRYKL